ncbi:prepilin-type N-terminal cleavage/methylation domain-containing protein [Thermodesulfobacteriota bacterium]
MKKHLNIISIMDTWCFSGTIMFLLSKKRKRIRPINGSHLENAGFTLLELVMVLVVAGIVGVVVVTRFMDTSVDLAVKTDVIKTHLRYAQTRAMSSTVIWGVEFQGTTYSLFRNGSASDTVYFPGEDSITLDLPSGVTFGSPTYVSFDSWGKPFNNASGTTVHPGGQIGDLSITLTENTGFIE